MKHPASYISDHLLPVMTVAFIGGIALAPLMDLATTCFLSYETALFCLLILLLFVLHFLKRSQVVLCLLIPLVFAIGYSHCSLRLQPPISKKHIYHAIKQKTDVVLIGTMATMAGYDGTTSQVTINTQSIRHEEQAALITTQGKVLLRLAGPWPDNLSPGDLLAIRTELKRPDSFRTPGVFDYAQYLAEKDIWITGFVSSPLFLHKIAKNRSLLHILYYLPEVFRTKIGKQIDRAVPPDRSGIYRAILLGDRSYVSDETLEIFKGSGTMHILAISGLHMAVIGTLLYTGFFWLFSRSEKLLLRYTVKKWAALLTLPVLLGYGLLAGMNTPVFRAVIMSSVVIIAICSNRPKSPGTLLAFAAMLILVMNPLQLFTASFQLSFAAVTGILFLLPVLKKIVGNRIESAPALSFSRKAINWLIAGLLVSLVANLATVPITLYFFNRFSLVGPLTNLIVEPLICLWSLGAGFLSIIFLAIQPEISSFLLQTGALGLGAAVHVAAFFSSWSFSTIWLPTPPPWLILIYYVALLAFMYSGWEKRRIWLPACVTLTACLWLLIYPPRRNPVENNKYFHITYLDIGQGSATLLEFPSGFRILIDGGGSSFASTTIGERVIAPFLWTKGIRKIDAIAITHPDADHYNGLEFIIRHFSPKILWTRDTEGHDKNFKQLIHLAQQHGMTLSIPGTNDYLLAGKESLMCLTNLANQGNGAENKGSRDVGNSGLILKACANQLCALFPGDIGRDLEHFLVTQNYDVQADVLLSPHHGSNTSNSSQFLTAVAPRYLFVSAGRSTKGYFPHKSLAEECNDQQIDLFTTADQGTLHIIATENGYHIYGYRKKNANPLYSFAPVLLGENTLTPR